MSHPRITCEVVRAERLPRDSARLARRDDVGALVRHAAGGDERAWTLLVHRFETTIHALARRHGLNPADRDEVAQRTWLALVRHIDRLGDHPAIAGWILTTARHECLRILNAARRELLSEEPFAGREPASEPVETTLLEAERRDAVRRALDSLPAHERRLMRVLLREPAPSYAEVCAELGIPKGSIGPTRGRCVARMRGDQHLASVVYGRPQPGHDLA
jgi:RNA polymerase sigma factor (sigma-70 family)